MKKYLLKTSETGSRYTVDYEGDLNPKQLEVVLAGDGPILVIAGAGSGKTRAVTYRVARLMESGVPPSHILLLTFTNKAAREMLHRVERLVQTDVRRVWGGTFHHVGNLVLRRHGERLGYRPNFTILDREDAKDLIDDIVGKTAKLASHKKFPRGDVLLEIHSLAVNTETPINQVIDTKYPVFFEIKDEILRALNRYTHHKKNLNVMDFDDLLFNWRELLRKHDDVLESYRNLYRHILVDEYQDTNRLQSDTVEMLAGSEGNLMVVGDDAQSIYSFRGADFGNIIDFPKRHPNCLTYKLETNYRSVPEVLDLANDSMGHNKKQFHKVLKAERPPGAKPELIVGADVFEQARFVVQRMIELQGEGIPLSEVAVLYRAHYHSMELQLELTQRGIPFQVRSGLRFFEQAHIKDVTSYLRIIANPRDEMAWKRVIKLYPKIGRATADAVWNALAETADPILAAKSEPILKKLQKGARKGWSQFIELVDVLSDPGLRKVPSEMTRLILERGYKDYLVSNYANFSARIDDIHRLSDFAVRYDDVMDLLSELALSANVAGKEALEEAEPTDTLVLSTIHQAKGLEWKVVFLIWLVDGKLPDARSLREDGGEEEERRLFYVAATRAKDQLYLVYPTLVDERGLMGVIQRPSRFILEIEPALYERTIIGYEDDRSEE